jgi:predicted GTPase
MKPSRFILPAVLILLPLAFLVGVGAFHIWERGWTFWAWWPMAMSMCAGYILAWRIQKQYVRARQKMNPPDFWTNRDRLAAEIIEATLKKTVTQQQMGEARFYFDTASELAQQISKVYQPEAKDPLDPVTIPELLAVIELAAHDLSNLTEKYIPASHLMAISHWRQTQKWIGRVNTISKGYWLFSTLLDPVKTAIRYGANQLITGKPLDMIQQNVLNWFYIEYVQRVGFYLIELYSGRLKVGASRYRELTRKLTEPNPLFQDKEKSNTPPLQSEKDTQNKAQNVSENVTIAVLGQVKAGKSSLINALLGTQLALTDVLPATSGISRYELKSPVNSEKLILLDTVGYGHEGPTEDQLETTAEAIKNADLLILVSHARNAARQADVKLFDSLTQWFGKHPQYKFPPTLIVMSHADLLSPAIEWAPPYNWRGGGQRPKEISIQNAIKAIQEVFPQFEIIPVCTASQKLWNVPEVVLASIVSRLDEARAVHLLRCLHAEADEGKVNKVFEQLSNLVKAGWHQFTK